jgi:hypothetical protein
MICFLLSPDFTQAQSRLVKFETKEKPSAMLMVFLLGGEGGIRTLGTVSRTAV